MPWPDRHLRDAVPRLESTPATARTPQWIIGDACQHYKRKKPRCGRETKLRWRAQPYFRGLVFFGVFFFTASPLDLLVDFAGFGGALEGFSASRFFVSGFAGAAATATAAAPFPLPLTCTSPFLPVVPAVPEVAEVGPLAPAAAAFAARPRLGGGGGGGGGGANGFRNLKVSVRERSLPSSKSMNTSRAIFGYSCNCGVISSSVISGRGIFCCTWRHLVKKFRIFCATAGCLAVTARNRTISGRASESSCQVREGVAASLPLSRLARSLACSSISRQASTRSLRGISRCRSDTSLL